MLKSIAIATTLATGLSLGAAPAMAAPANLNTTTALMAPASGLTAQSPVIEITSPKYKHKKHHYSHRRLGPRQIVRILERRGFRNVRVVDLGPRRAVVRARGRRGPVRLLVSRRTGEVIAREVLRRGGHHHRYGHGPRYRHHDRGGYSFSFGFNL